MTENEAIGQLKYMYKTCMDEKCKHKGQCDLCCESRDMAIQALEEIQQYRAIGTIEEFKALKKKNEPKKIDIRANGEEHCPFCDKNITTFYSFANCFSCGQKLDWQ